MIKRQIEEIEANNPAIARVSSELVNPPFNFNQNIIGKSCIAKQKKQITRKPKSNNKWQVELVHNESRTIESREEVLEAREREREREREMGKKSYQPAMSASECIIRDANKQNKKQRKTGK
ncbi:uncharacterized protein EAF02_002490 [Botrytis sinoallii]|uniref:uncharacterized protein n=1 Tax=Botrytis sinoallii TaxID=1463999 RepID=UPI00190195EA|nr:uncharacterized protein EAF02_002490 [Botrytis sinoallii]KAF7890075.1 hypothetical protein EAF02_002490 [Botrytis sinoallii]